MRIFWAGGARGFDALAARTVLDLKRKYPGLQLFLALPCRNQTAGWNTWDQNLHNEIKARADRIVYVSESYFRGCMHKRNRFMVEQSGHCICFLIRGTGGAKYTVDECLKSGVKVYSLADRL